MAIENSQVYRVFIYGTLKTGQPLHYVIESPSESDIVCKLLDAGTTVEKMPLVLASPDHYPVLLDAVGQGHRVAGEVYEVNDKLLHIFDAVERSPKHYTRIEIPVELSASKQIVNCFVYAVQNFKPELLKLPFYEEYDYYGGHGLKFDVKKYENITGEESEKLHAWAFSYIKDVDKN